MLVCVCSIKIYIVTSFWLIFLLYKDKGDLAHFIRKKGKLSIPVSLQIFKQILRGLTFAHSHSIIHRDLVSFIFICFFFLFRIVFIFMLYFYFIFIELILFLFIIIIRNLKIFYCILIKQPRLEIGDFPVTGPASNKSVEEEGAFTTWPMKSSSIKSILDLK